MKSKFLELFEQVELELSQPVTDDTVSFIINEEIELEIPVVEHTNGSIVLAPDDFVYKILAEENVFKNDDEVELDVGYDKYIKPNDDDEEKPIVTTPPEREIYTDPKLKDLRPLELEEAKYQGREVNLGKPMAGDVKKYKVYVKDPQTGNIKKVNFGDKKLSIKRDQPSRRKNFRARHRCATAKDRTSARYWSCRMWSSKPVSKILKGK